MLEHERAEAPDRQGVAAHLRLCRDGRRASRLVDERDLAERGARAERAHLVAVHGHRRLAALDDEEVQPAEALAGDLLARLERALDELVGEPQHAGVVEVGEERDAADEFGAGACHAAILYIPRRWESASSRLPTAQHP